MPEKIEHLDELVPFSHDDYESLKKRVTCVHCEEHIGIINIAGVTIKHGGNYFCSSVCLEEWLDWQETAKKIKNRICPDCGSEKCMADGVTGLWCSVCDASYLLGEKDDVK